jgi:hypothetical protein
MAGGEGKTMAVLAALLLWGAALGGCGGDDTAVPADGGGGSDARRDGGAASDALAGDGGGSASASRFLSETAGGARLESASYRMELFVAPVRQTGGGTSTNYKLQLGPAALRNAR